MASNVWITVAGLSGATAVALGAIGSHAFKHQSEHMKDTWRIATNYHFIHTLALAISALHFTGRKRTVVCGFFSAGIAVFCGSLYAIVLADSRSPFAHVAPFGGMSFIAGWLAFALL